MSKNKLTNESGITLVELLAAISLLSVVILLVGSIHMFGQRQFIRQTESAEQANDLSYALNILSSDLRKQNINNVQIKNNQIFFKEDSDNRFSSHPVYYVDKNTQQLIKNETVISDSVSEMLVEFDVTNIGIKITLKSSSQHSTQKIYNTKVTFRRLSENEPESN